ncbi:MAG TPA: hypothetical protein VFS97_14180 [Nitrososphaeraceae archaeon]|nr:hypothetical protein [Nitrososphaeraceae archaeon]
MTISVNGHARVNVLDLAGELVVSISKIRRKVPTKLVVMMKCFILQRWLGRSCSTTTSSKGNIDTWKIYQAILNRTIFDFNCIVCCFDVKFRISEFL